MSVSARFSREGVGGLEGLVLSLVHRAARSAPPSLSERLEEEWLADLAARHGTLARLCFALGCTWARRVIVHELGAPAHIAAAASGRATASVCVPAAPSLYSRRTAVVLLIVALHLLLIYGLVTGMAHAVLKRIPDAIEATFVKPAARIAPPPPPEVRLGAVRVPVPSTLSIEVDPGPAAITDTSIAPIAPIQTPHPSRPIVRVLGGPGRDFPNSADFYPDASRRLGETGVATIQACVDDNGRLTAQPRVVQSSGSARLDAGAVKLAIAGSGHYRATTEDGRPVQGCYAFRVRFDFRK